MGFRNLSDTHMNRIRKSLAVVVVGGLCNWGSVHTEAFVDRVPFVLDLKTDEMDCKKYDKAKA